MKLFESAQKPFTAKPPAFVVALGLGLLMAAQWLAAAPLCQTPNPIPLFQFEVFYYQDELEIEPGAPMTITGPVQANNNIYLAPENSLTFASTVATSGEIFLQPGASGLINFDGPLVTNGFPFILPGDNQVNNGWALLQIPESGSSPASTPGALYNQADMIVIISNNNTVTVTSGAGIDGQATVISDEQWQIFLGTNGAFFDQRDGLTVNPAVLDVSNLVTWSATNTVLRAVLGNLRGSGAADVHSIYVADLRTNIETVTTLYVTNMSYTTNNFYTTNPPPAPAPGTYVPSSLSVILKDGRIVDYVYIGINEVLTTNPSYLTNILTVQPGLVLSNGAVLPPQGLAIATPDPAYIVGNWNIKNSTNAGAPSDAGLSDTTYTLPSAIYADAITVLSPAWNPADSALSLGSRIAANDTVNAAFYAGNVPSVNSNYSGGLENFPRLLENWSGETFTWNGSMCCMFESQIASAPYPGTGTVYEPPVRNWAYDMNFNDPAKLPPLTPAVEMPAPVRIQSITEQNGAITLSWNSWPGVTYNVQYATDLSLNNWKTLVSITAASAFTIWSEPAANPQRFYRLQVNL
jgi:hypothetical protein